MAPKRRRRASARKGAKKGGSMGGGISIGGGPYLCFMYDLGIMWIGKMIAL